MFTSKSHWSATRDGRPQWSLLRGLRTFLSSVRRVVALAAVVLLVMVVPLIIWQFAAPDEAQAAWFDGSFGYRKALTFTHNAALTNRRISFTIDTATLTTDKLQASCNDSRFTDANGKVLDFQVVSGCDTSSTTYDVIFPTIISGSNLAFFYYGNPSAGNASKDVSSFTALTPSGGAASFATEEVTPGPVAEWKFDEAQGQTVQDSTSNNSDGTLGATSGSSTDDPAWVSEGECVSGNCLRFDGGDFVTASLSSSLPTYSMSAWVKLGAMTPGAAIVGQNGVLTPTMAISANNSFQCSSTFGASGTATTNTWYHVECVQSALTQQLYVNGNLLASTSNTLTLQPNIFIGKRNDGASLNGTIDEIKIYPYARTAAQIQTDYNSGSAKLGSTNQAYLSNGLVGYWRMDESSWTVNCSTASVLDASGNGNNGTACPTSTGPAGGAAGKYGNGGSFDGSNDYVNTAASFNTTFQSSYSVGFWMKPTDGQPTSTQMIFGTETSNHMVRLSIMQGGGNDGKLRLQYVANNVTVYAQTNAAVFSDGAATNWTHIGVTADATKNGPGGIKILINGAEVALASGSAGDTSAITFSQYSNTQNVYIGASNSIGTASSFYAGGLDDFRIYNRALSPAEVADLYSFAPGPVGHWKFDEGSGTSAVDSSGNGNAGTLTNGPTWTQGKIGKAVNFDGSNDVVNVGDISAFNLSQLTVEAWINPSALANKSIVDKFPYDLGTNGWRINTRSNGDIWFSYGNANSNDQAIATSSYTGNSWSHVVGTYDGITLKIYVNGVLKGSQASTKTYTATGRVLSIGSNSGFSNIPGSFEVFQGSIDDVRIYNYVRTQEQIIQDMQGDAPPDVSGQKLPDPVAYYSLDEQQGQTANNKGLGGSTLNGTLGATSGSSTDDPTWKTKADCKINGCQSFDGGDYVDLGDQPATEGVSQLTVSTWVKGSTYPALTCFVCKANLSGSPTQYSWVFETYGTNAVVAGIAPTTTTDAYGTSPTNSLTTNAWNHVVMVFDGTQTGNTNRLKIYINGKLQTLTFGGTIPATTQATTSNVKIGATSDNARFFTGSLDEVKIYNTALTADQVQQDMNAGSVLSFGTTANSEASLFADGAGLPPVAEWKFDEKTGSSAGDTSGNGNTGTLTNGPTWASGKEGGALQFDGINDQVRVTYNAGYYTFPITINTLINPSITTGTARTFINFGLNSDFRYRANINTSGNVVFLIVNSDTTQTSITSTTTLTANQWSHVSFVVSNSKVSMYINGVLNTETAYAKTPVTVSQNLVIGVQDASNNTSPYIGKIDSIKIYNYARTQSQVAYDYNRGAPIGWWKADECQGNTLNDSSNNGLAGTLTVGGSGNQTSIGTCNTASTAWGNGASGKFNSSVNFDGTDDYVQIPDNDKLDALSTGSVAFWYKPNYSGSPLTPSSFFSKGSTNASLATYGAYHYTNGVVAFHLNTSSGISLATWNPTAGNWYHMFFSWDGLNVKWYLNGQLYANAATTNPSGSSALPFYIGAYNFNTSSLQYGNAGFDDFRIYNYALGADQVKQVYNGGAAVKFGQ